MFMGGDLLGIDIKCNTRQRDLLTRTIAYVEAWPDDANRVRFVFTDGRKGKWFSREWRNLTFGNVAPK